MRSSMRRSGSSAASLVRRAHAASTPLDESCKDPSHELVPQTVRAAITTAI